MAPMLPSAVSSTVLGLLRSELLQVVRPHDAVGGPVRGQGVERPVRRDGIRVAETQCHRLVERLVDRGSRRLDGGRWQVDHGGQVDHSQAWFQPRHGHGQGLHPQRHRERREPRGREHLEGGRRGDRRVHRVRVVDVRRSHVHAAQHQVLQQPGPARAGVRRRRWLVAHPSRDLERVAEPQARLAGGGELREGQDHVGADQARCRERRLRGISVVVEHDLSGDFVGEVGSAVVLADQEQRRGDAGERDLLVRQGRRRRVDGCRLRGRYVVGHPLLQPDGQGCPVERMAVLVGAVPTAPNANRVGRRTEPTPAGTEQVRVAAIGEPAAVPGVGQRVAAAPTHGADNGRHQRREHGGRDGESRHPHRTRVRERRRGRVELGVRRAAGGSGRREGTRNSPQAGG